MWDTNIWARWGITYTTRDGSPILTETVLWQLWSNHPEAVEQVSESQYFIHLDQTYRATRHATRAYLVLVPEPGRRRPAA